MAEYFHQEFIWYSQNHFEITGFAKVFFSNLSDKMERQKDQYLKSKERMNYIQKDKAQKLFFPPEIRSTSLNHEI